MSVSVIIPTYNDILTVPRAISSALGQTVSVKEVIVVDDDSKDDTEATVKSFEDGRVQYIKHDRNQGGSAARNTGLEYASGDYVAYLDADDEWLPRKLEKQLNELNSRSDDWIAAHCDRTWDFSLYDRVAFTLSTVVGNKKKNPPKEGGDELIKEILSLNLSTGASTLLVKRSVVESISGFDPDFPRHQDWEFLIRVLQQGKLAYVDEPLVIKHDSGRPSIESFKEGKRLLLTKFADEVEEAESQGIRARHIQRTQLAKLYISDGELRFGFEQLDLSELNIRELLSVLWYVPEGLFNIFKQIKK